MKVILTGSTGFIGQEVLHQCIQQPKITSILVLSRRALPTEVTANNSKVKVVMVNDFRKYSDDIVQDFRDADACIWCIGTYSATSRSEEIELEYPAALCNALAKVQQQGRAFTWVQLSGALVVTDQQRSLWFYPVTRKIKGRGETNLLQFADKQQAAGRHWSSYIVRPGGVMPKGTAWFVSSVLGYWWSIRVEELAAAMIDTALNGDDEQRLYHSKLVVKGRRLLEQKA